MKSLPSWITPAYLLITLTLTLLSLSLLIPSTTAVIEDYDTEFKIKLSFISWGERCKIPTQDEFLLPQDGCDGTKGIICQKYSQGTYCGCPIESKFLSYDKRSGECRRKVGLLINNLLIMTLSNLSLTLTFLQPGEHCLYVNVTMHPYAYQRLPALMKCHEAAECVKRVITSEEALAKRSTREVDKCICRWGYVPSRDGLGCDSVNKSDSLFSSGGSGRRDALLLNLLGVLVLLRFWW